MHELTTTFDMFGDDQAVQPQPAGAPVVVSFMMEPTGQPNRWRYRGVEVLCDMKLEGFIGHWQTVAPLGAAVLKSDRRVDLCKVIDAHLGPKDKPCAT